MSKKNFRSSRQREHILEIVREADNHPTVDWIYAKLKPEFPKLSLGTVYRNIAVLVEQGFVQRIQSGSTFDRYEANMSNHYHLICESCGKIVDFNLSINPDIEKLASRKSDFTITGHRINFFGICPECKKRS